MNPFIFDGYIVQLAWRLLAILAILQIITLVSITVSYKWRRWKSHQSGFQSIDLESLSIAEADLQIYMEGVSLFADMELSIQRAQSSIMFETFIWKNDVLGRKFRDLYVQKAKEGVEVYIVYDFIGNGILGGSRIKFPKDIPTLHVARYFSFKRFIHIFSPSRYNVSHRKILLVDDKIGYVGGYNLGEEYRTKWRDTHIRISGPASRELAHAFVDFWNHYVSKQNQLEYPKLSWSPILDVYRNDPRRRNYPIRSLYLQAIEQAQEYIRITNAYFVPDRAFRRALIDAAQRGVDIEVILPWESNHLVVDWVARHWFKDYLDAGLKLFGYQAAMIHTKTITVDGIWSTIGTANLDRLSLWLNHEVNVAILDAGVAQQMEEIFACDKKQTQEITSVDWGNRPFRARLGERILAPLWPFI